MDSAESKALRDLTRAINQSTAAIKEMAKVTQQATKVNLAAIEAAEKRNLKQQESFDAYQEGHNHE